MVKKSEGRNEEVKEESAEKKDISKTWADNYIACLLYTSDAADE